MIAFSPRPNRIVSIDPGTNTLGIACLEINESFSRIRVVDAVTLDAARLARRKYAFQLETFGEKYAKLVAIKDALLRYYVAWHPLAVCSESPYMHLYPATFAALTECVSIIQRSAVDYDPCCVVRMIAPSEAKKAVGVSGGSSDKEAVRKGILQHGCIDLDVDMSLLDEHAVDAIAIGVAYLQSGLCVAETT